MKAVFLFFILSTSSLISARADALNTFANVQLRPFVSDGCSRSPDGLIATKRSSVWVSCCVAHDTAYWLGGTEDQKEKADDELRMCIEAKGFPKIAKLYHFFVSRYGGPETEQPYRWGYGWNYRRSYAPITEAEEAMVVQIYGANSGVVLPILLKHELQEGRFKTP